VRLLTAVIAAVLAAAGAPAASAQAPERAELWAVGDAATPNDGARRLAAHIRSQSPDRFLYLGDVYEDGTARDFRLNYDPLYGALATITDPTPGNHEWEHRFTGYYPYWRARKGHRQPPWSSTSIGGWQILALNSMAAHHPRSRQLRWLRRTLAASGGDCRIAFWHRPRFSAGMYEDSPDLAPFWNALRGRAKVVLSGHDHNLQRLRPRNGLTQYVAGAGGASAYGVDQDDPRLAWGADRVFGALRIVLEPGGGTFEFRDSRGRLLDRSRTTCDPALGRPPRRVLGERLQVVLEAGRRLHPVEPRRDARVLTRVRARVGRTVDVRVEGDVGDRVVVAGHECPAVRRQAALQ
jgi:acid phosphatase type 7